MRLTCSRSVATAGRFSRNECVGIVIAMLVGPDSKKVQKVENAMCRETATHWLLSSVVVRATTKKALLLVVKSTE